MACSNQSKISNSLLSYLTENGEKTLLRLKEDYRKYDLEASKRDGYLSNIEYLEKNYRGIYWEDGTPLKTTNIYKDIEALVGYWVSDGEHMINLCWMMISETPAEQFTLDYNLHPDESWIIEMNSVLNLIKENDVAAKWAAICSKKIQEVSSNIKSLESLLDFWKMKNTGWVVEKVGNNVYAIKGKALGLYVGDQYSAQWKYNSEKQLVEPADAYAKSLYDLLNSYLDYEETKSRSEIQPTPYKLPESRCTWYMYWDYYYGSGGKEVPTEELASTSESPYPFASNLSQKSSEVTSMLATYPKIKEYWNILEEIGFTVTYGGTYKKDGKDTILIQVTP